MSALLELGAGFHSDLSGRENVFLNGAILGMPPQGAGPAVRRHRRVRRAGGVHRPAGAQLLDRDDGPPRVRRSPSTSIPTCSIIDEVLAVGDAEFQAKCRDKITEFREAGKTIVLVTHGLSDVLGLCDHGAVARPRRDARARRPQRDRRRLHRRRPRRPQGRAGRGDALGHRARRGCCRMELSTPTGRPVAFGRTGEPLTFRLHYAAYQPLENVVIGIGLRPPERPAHERARTPAATVGRSPVLDGTGYVDYVIPSLGLLEGTYELTAAIQDWTEAHDYDHWRHGLRFDVLPSTVHEEGYVSLQGGWRLDGVADLPRRHAVSTLAELTTARELFWNLTLRELRTRYKRSALGWAWSMLNPLATMLIYSFVFVTLLESTAPVGDPSGLQAYGLFILCAILPVELHVDRRRHVDGRRARQRRRWSRRSRSRASTWCWPASPRRLVTLFIELGVLSVVMLFFGRIVAAADPRGRRSPPSLLSAFVVGLGLDAVGGQRVLPRPQPPVGHRGPGVVLPDARRVPAGDRRRTSCPAPAVLDLRPPADGGRGARCSARCSTTGGTRPSASTGGWHCGAHSPSGSAGRSSSAWRPVFPKSSEPRC